MRSIFSLTTLACLAIFCFKKYEEKSQDNLEVSYTRNIPPKSNSSYFRFVEFGTDSSDFQTGDIIQVPKGDSLGVPYEIDIVNPLSFDYNIQGGKVLIDNKHFCVVRNNNGEHILLIPCESNTILLRRYRNKNIDTISSTSIPTAGNPVPSSKSAGNPDGGSSGVADGGSFNISEIVASDEDIYFTNNLIHGYDVPRYMLDLTNIEYIMGDSTIISNGVFISFYISNFNNFIQYSNDPEDIQSFIVSNIYFDYILETNTCILVFNSFNNIRIVILLTYLIALFFLNTFLLQYQLSSIYTSVGTIIRLCLILIVPLFCVVGGDFYYSLFVGGHESRLILGILGTYPLKAHTWFLCLSNLWLYIISTFILIFLKVNDSKENTRDRIHQRIPTIIFLYLFQLISLCGSFASIYSLFK